MLLKQCPTHVCIQSGMSNNCITFKKYKLQNKKLNAIRERSEAQENKILHTCSYLEEKTEPI